MSVFLEEKYYLSIISVGNFAGLMRQFREYHPSIFSLLSGLVIVLNYSTNFVS